VSVATTHTKVSRIGTRFLQYGKTTLDYKKKRFYFEPFDNIDTNKPAENRWAIYPTFKNDKMVVGIIWDKELESQINLGDEILSINGIDIQSMNFCEKYMLKIPDSDKRILELRDINTGEIKKVEIDRMQLK
jgi:C-terminal processing protease CtpA/Prc